MQPATRTSVGERARALEVHSDAIPHAAGRPALMPVRLRGHEGVNRLFEYELVLRTTTAFIGRDSAADIDLDGFIGREITCNLEIDGMGTFAPGRAGAAADRVGAGVREINALVTHAAVLGEVGRHVEYRLTLRPWLHLATLTTDCKVFQDKTVVEILDELLAAYAFPLEKRLYGLPRADRLLYPPRDYQTQYNESDFDFFERLCQEWGISFHFEHARGAHRLVLCDSIAAYRETPSEAYRQIEFHPPGWKTDAEHLHDFRLDHRLTSGRYTTLDYDYTRPHANLAQTRHDPRPTGQAGSEVYQWHHGAAGAHFAQPRAGARPGTDPLEEGRHLALLRMDALRTGGVRAQARGNLRGMVPGCTFELLRHPVARANARYLILDTVLEIEDVAQAADGDPQRVQSWQAKVELSAHPLGEPLRPALTRTKPHVHGPQTALVVGPEGQDLWTDELGRIKVQFPWDRIGARNANSSCWVRVSSPWAGNQLGAAHWPRVGQEVIVDFIGGDPDLPVCTGRVHNQMNLPPWSLPTQSALSGLRSRELVRERGNSAAGRSNHLILDDTEARIQVQLKSDHLHSQLSLGHIARIEDNAGRKDERGEGFELRTDGHGAVRARHGLYLSTEAREGARGPIKEMGETVRRLSQAHEQHRALAELAEHHRAQQDGADQKAVSGSLETQNEQIRGAPDGVAFPELSQPHLLASSAAGIQATARGSTHIASGEHAAVTSGGHTSIASGRSFLASALDAVRLFAHKAGIRLVAAQGAVQVQAHDDMVELIARRAVEIISESDWIRLKAREGISLEVPGHAFTLSASRGFEAMTRSSFHVWSADFQTFGPKAPPSALPQLPESVCIRCLLKAAQAGSAISAF